MSQSAIAMSTLELQDVTHQLVQQFIGELKEMLDDLAAGGLSSSQRNVLSKILTFFDTQMERHHLEEEEYIFPLLLSQADDGLTRKVEILKGEHEQLRSGWLELRHAIDQMLTFPGTDASALWDNFQQYSECFAGHLALEEAIQFSPETRLLFSGWDS